MFQHILFKRFRTITTILVCNLFLFSYITSLQALHFQSYFPFMIHLNFHVILVIHFTNFRNKALSDISLVMYLLA